MTLALIIVLMVVLVGGLVLFPLLGKGKKGAGNTKIFAGLAALILVVSGGVYYFVGTPELAGDREFMEGFEQSASPAGEENLLPSIDDYIEGIKARLKENPGNLDDWSDLAFYLLNRGRYQEAADAYLQALVLAPDAAELQTAYGEALTLAADGYISFDAIQAFQEAVRLNPDEVIAKVYLGDYDLQEGNPQAAYDGWLALYEQLPEDTPWLPYLDQRIRDVSSRLGIEPPQILAEKQYQEPEVTAQDLDQMSTEDQMAMIESMVEGLAARLEKDPTDLDGWQRLGQSYMVLGRYEEGVRAFGMVASARPDDPQALGSYIQSMMTWLEQTGQHINDEALGALQQLVALEPENPMALYYLGQAAAERSDPASARLYWMRLLAMLPEGTEGADIIQQKLDDLN